MSRLETKRVDERLAYVVKHPIRVDALAIFNEQTVSKAEVAKLMDLPVSTVAPHINALLEAGCIEVARSERRRGAFEIYYRATLRANISEEVWATLPLETRREISALTFQAIVAEGSGALRTGKFDSRKNRHQSWDILTLDEEGWLELIEEKKRSLEETEAIQARSYRRLTKSDEKAISVVTASLAFERAGPRRSPGHMRIE